MTNFRGFFYSLFVFMAFGVLYGKKPSYLKKFMFTEVAVVEDPAPSSTEKILFESFITLSYTGKL